MDDNAKRLRPEPDREPKTQYAALPWRRTPEGTQVLLITSRETKRWVIPKGWPIKKLKPPASAAQEALEEAGVTGQTTRKALGVYHYDKRLRSGRTQHVRVLVFGLEVHDERHEWPEKAERERRWTSAAEAAELVDEKELKRLLAAFSP